MAYTHGVRTEEVPTSLLPTAESDAGIPVFFGTAPIGMTADETNVNKPVLCYSYAEAVAAFGFVPAKLEEKSKLKKFDYTISEFIDSAFSKFGISPVIIVNVLDPTKHKGTQISDEEFHFDKRGTATIAKTGIILSTVEIKKDPEETKTLNEDYVLSFNEAGELVITSLLDERGEYKLNDSDTFKITAEVTDPTKVQATDIIGGVSADGKKSGLELVSEVFPRFRLVPGILLAPGFSDSPAVAAALSAKCQSINSVFNAVAVADLPTKTVKKYSDAPKWKNDNNYVDEFLVACWPMVQLDGVAYHLSTQAACLMALTDSENSDVPYVSPSNKNLQMTGLCLEDGSEVVIGQDEAAYLNGEGLATALNFIGGWVLWGNRTSCYPGNTDVKDAFIPVRRMMNWIGNTLVQTFWQRVDFPLNRRQINTVMDSCNIWLNGLASREFILGGRVEFLSSENTTTDLMDGKARFHVFVTPPSPNREIDFILEYDPQYLETLFS